MTVHLGIIVPSIEKPSRSLVQRIPPELLGEIFVHCLPRSTYLQATPHKAPLLLCQVCTAWRSVGLSMPKLWSSLHVTISSQGSTPCIPLIQLWLDRSGAYPLALSLALDEFPPVADNLAEAATAVLDVFTVKSVYWQNLALVLPGSHMLLRGVFKDSAPRLENLSLDLRDWKNREADDLNLALQSIQCLRRFSWSNRSSWGSWDMRFEDVLSTLKVPWSQLTHIVLDSLLCLDDALGILRQCDSLVECDFRHFAGGLLSDDFLDSPPFTLPHLFSFKIYQLQLDKGLGSLLDLFVCPVLHNFSIAFGYIDTVPWPQAQFGAFLSRSSCPLETLVLEFTGLSEDDLVECLQIATASLVRLEVIDVRGDICVTDRLLTMLTRCEQPVGSSRFLCPNLEVLVLKHVISSSDGIFAAMISSRWRHRDSPRHHPSRASLKYVHVIFTGGNSRHKVDIKRLLEFRCEGLVVNGI